MKKLAIFALLLLIAFFPVIFAQTSGGSVSGGAPVSGGSGGGAMSGGTVSGGAPVTPPVSGGASSGGVVTEPETPAEPPVVVPPETEPETPPVVTPETPTEPESPVVTPPTKPLNPLALHDRNCKDFGSRAEAQSFYEGYMSVLRFDAHKLDPDADGFACESLKK